MPTLSACMIVRDEAHQLAEILGQCQFFADEIIIVDTGSVDNTKKVANEFTDKIFDFPWCDDFSAARNHAISKATGHYIFIIDADERINKANQQLICQLKNHFDGKRAFQCLTICKTSDGSSPPCLQVRCFPNSENIYYQGKIHEGLWNSLTKAEIEVKQTNIGIIHTGYIDNELLFKKKARNLMLLKKAVPDAKTNYYLGQISEGLQDYHTANKYYQAALPYVESKAEKRSLILYELLVGLIRVNDEIGDIGAMCKYFKNLCAYSKNLPPENIIGFCTLAERVGIYEYLLRGES